MSAIYPTSAFVRWEAILLAAAVSVAGCDSHVDPESSAVPVAVHIKAATEMVVTGTVGTEVTPAPAVQATDSEGNSLPGVAISFQVASGGGTIARTAVETDEDGSASVGTWTLGPVTGTFTLTASSGGRVRVVFTATAKAGPVEQITSESGTNQTAAAHARLLQHLKVKVSDSFGNPIVDAPVTFTVITGGGTIENGSVVTGADGIAESGAWTLGRTEGEQQVRAESGEAHVVFSAVAYRPSAALTDLEGRLAFVSTRDGNREIYTINADGTALARLTNYSGNDDGPAWSPDGSQIAFTSDGAILVMTAEGRIVARRASGSQPAWSPSGSSIAFSTLHDGSAAIATVDNNDAAVRFLPDDAPGYDAQPSWSPDGRQFAFVSDWVAYDFVFDIYTINVDGTGRRQLTQGFQIWPNLRYYLHPAWSPDGSMIAFVYGTIVNGSYAIQIDSDMRFKVAVMSADGGFIKDLAWAGDIPWMELLDPGSLTWSPDGLGIAYSFVDCDLVLKTSCSKVRSVNYVSLDGSRHGTIVQNGHSPSWTR